MSELPDDILELQQLAFRYFLDHTNAENGLVADNSSEDSAGRYRRAERVGYGHHYGSLVSRSVELRSRRARMVL